MPDCPPNKLTSRQALRVLGLDPQTYMDPSGRLDIKVIRVNQAYRRLIVAEHPDHAGAANTARACYINGARETLLRLASK